MDKLPIDHAATAMDHLVEHAQAWQHCGTFAPYEEVSRLLVATCERWSNALLEQGMEIPHAAFMVDLESFVKLIREAAAEHDDTK